MTSAVTYLLQLPISDQQDCKPHADRSSLLSAKRALSQTTNRGLTVGSGNTFPPHSITTAARSAKYPPIPLLSALPDSSAPATAPSARPAVRPSRSTHKTVVLVLLHSSQPPLLATHNLNGRCAVRRPRKQHIACSPVNQAMCKRVGVRTRLQVPKTRCWCRIPSFSGSTRRC
jgi:hypothetical protein